MIQGDSGVRRTGLWPANYVITPCASAIKAGPPLAPLTSSRSRAGTTGERVRVVMPPVAVTPDAAAAATVPFAAVRGMGLAPRLPVAGLLSRPDEERSGLLAPFGVWVDEVDTAWLGWEAGVGNELWSIEFAITLRPLARAGRVDDPPFTLDEEDGVSTPPLEACAAELTAPLTAATALERLARSLATGDVANRPLFDALERFLPTPSMPRRFISSRRSASR